MLKDIIFISASEMRRVKPRLDTIVVSMLDESERADRPRLGGFRSILALTFEDAEEARDHPNWPDEPSDEQHVAFASGRGERVPTLGDARKVVEFLWRHQRQPDELHLVVHCFAGLSRSAAVAEWASARWRAPILGLDKQSTDRANRRLLRLLDKAWTQMLAEQET